MTGRFFQGLQKYMQQNPKQPILLNFSKSAYQQFYGLSSGKLPIFAKLKKQ